MIVRSQTAQRRLDNNQIAVVGGCFWATAILNAHPQTATGHQVIWLQSFKRKFSFYRVGQPVHE
jgi:hypothetical protein